MYINKRWGRKGNLFHRRFKRLAVRSNAHLTRLIYYIHANPRKHGLMKEFSSYEWSSYQLLLFPETKLLKRDTVMEWFGGFSPFIQFHQNPQEPLPEDDLEEKEKAEIESS